MAYVDPAVAADGTNWNAGAPGATHVVRVVNAATCVANDPSPAYPAPPVPASVRMVPSAFTRRTRLELVSAK
jgi:hypothetical protein